MESIYRIYLWNLSDLLADLRDQIYGPFILELKICVDSPGSCFKGLQIRRLIDFHPGVFQFLQLPVLFGSYGLPVFFSVYSSAFFQDLLYIFGQFLPGRL